jgi:hypothetical protein
MVNRWIGIVSIALVLIANYKLFERHILPRYLVGEAPPTAAQTLEDGEERYVQVGIYAYGGQLIGRSWTIADRLGDATSIRSLTVLEPITINTVRTLPVALDMTLDFQSPDHPDELRIEILGLGMDARLRGEYFSGDFPCEWEFGDQRGRFLVDAEVLSTLGDAVRPFDRLPGLYVGQTWQVTVFNPFQQMFDLGGGLEIEKVLVEVTHEEPIEDPHTGEEINAFVVEAPGATAWVAPGGRVIKQAVQLPIFGRLEVVDERFDPDSFEVALRTWSVGDPKPSPLPERSSWFDPITPAEDDVDE